MKTRNYKDLLVDSHAGADPGFQARGGAHIQKLRENFGVFRVKNHDFKPKNHIFSNCRGDARRVPRPPPHPWIRPCNVG